MSQLTNTTDHYLATARASTTRTRQLTGTNITLVEALKMDRSGGRLQKKLSDAVAKAGLKQLKYSYTQDVCHLGGIDSAATACLPFMALPSAIFLFLRRSLP
jgi:hypothetical protein